MRINIDIEVPKMPENPPKIRYNKPMSLWLVEKSHLDEKR